MSSQFVQGFLPFGATSAIWLRPEQAAHHATRSLVMPKAARPCGHNREVWQLADHYGIDKPDLGQAAAQSVLLLFGMFPPILEMRAQIAGPDSTQLLDAITIFMATESFPKFKQEWLSCVLGAC